MSSTIRAPCINSCSNTDMMADESPPSDDPKTVTPSDAATVGNDTAIKMGTNDDNTANTESGADIADLSQEHGSQSHGPASFTATEKKNIPSADEDYDALATKNTEESLIDLESDNQAEEVNPQFGQYPYQYTNDSQDDSFSSFKSLTHAKPSKLIGDYNAYAKYPNSPTQASGAFPVKSIFSQSESDVSSEDDDIGSPVIGKGLKMTAGSSFLKYNDLHEEGATSLEGQDEATSTLDDTWNGTKVEPAPLASTFPGHNYEEGVNESSAYGQGPDNAPNDASVDALTWVQPNQEPASVDAPTWAQPNQEPASVDAPTWAQPDQEQYDNPFAPKVSSTEEAASDDDNAESVQRGESSDVMAAYMHSELNGLAKVSLLHLAYFFSYDHAGDGDAVIREQRDNARKAFQKVASQLTKSLKNSFSLKDEASQLATLLGDLRNKYPMLAEALVSIGLDDIGNEVVPVTDNFMNRLISWTLTVFVRFSAPGEKFPYVRDPHKGMWAQVQSTTRNLIDVWFSALQMLPAPIFGNIAVHLTPALETAVNAGKVAMTQQLQDKLASCKPLTPLEEYSLPWTDPNRRLSTVVWHQLSNEEKQVFSACQQSFAKGPSNHLDRKLMSSQLNPIMYPASASSQVEVTTKAKFEDAESFACFEVSSRPEDMVYVPTADKTFNKMSANDHRLKSYPSGLQGEQSIAKALALSLQYVFKKWGPVILKDTLPEAMLGGLSHAQLDDALDEWLLARVKPAMRNVFFLENLSPSPDFAIQQEEYLESIEKMRSTRKDNSEHSSQVLADRKKAAKDKLTVANQVTDQAEENQGDGGVVPEVDANEGWSGEMQQPVVEEDSHDNEFKSAKKAVPSSGVSAYGMESLLHVVCLGLGITHKVRLGFIDDDNFAKWASGRFDTAEESLWIWKEGSEGYFWSGVGPARLSQWEAEKFGKPSKDSLPA